MTDFIDHATWSLPAASTTDWDTPSPWVWRPTSVPALRQALQEHLDTRASQIVVLDAAGCVVGVNKAWRESARAAGMIDPANGLGSNYLDICERASGESQRDAQIVARGIRDVISGQFASVYFRYGFEVAQRRHLYSVRISRLKHETPLRVVVEHERIL